MISGSEDAVPGGSAAGLWIVCNLIDLLPKPMCWKVFIFCWTVLNFLADTCYDLPAPVHNTRASASSTEVGSFFFYLFFILICECWLKLHSVDWLC